MISKKEFRIARREGEKRVAGKNAYMVRAPDGDRVCSCNRIFCAV